MKNATALLLAFSLLLSLFPSVSEARVRLEAPTIPVSLSEAFADAQALLRVHDQASIMQVSGSSMHPFFGSGSLLVVKPMAFSRLSKGMVVVYTNRFGETVAHRLVSADASGWVARGYNNESDDSTRVTAANLVGVVYATIHTGEAQASLPGVRVALAAPAR